MAKHSSAIDLVYGLDDKPRFSVSEFAALQHMLASFIGIITPTLIVGGVLGLGKDVPYMVSMALIVSGIGTFIQVRRIGPVVGGVLPRFLPGKHSGCSDRIRVTTSLTP